MRCSLCVNAVWKQSATWKNKAVHCVRKLCEDKAQRGRAKRRSFNIVACWKMAGVAAALSTEYVTLRSGSCLLTLSQEWTYSQHSGAQYSYQTWSYQNHFSNLTQFLFPSTLLRFARRSPIGPLLAFVCRSDSADLQLGRLISHLRQMPRRFPLVPIPSPFADAKFSKFSTPHILLLPAL